MSMSYFKLVDKKLLKLIVEVEVEELVRLFGSKALC